MLSFNKKFFFLVFCSCMVWFGAFSQENNHYGIGVLQECYSKRTSKDRVFRYMVEDCIPSKLKNIELNSVLDFENGNIKTEYLLMNNGDIQCKLYSYRIDGRLSCLKSFYIGKGDTTSLKIEYKLPNIILSNYLGVDKIESFVFEIDTRELVRRVIARKNDLIYYIGLFEYDSENKELSEYQKKTGRNNTIRSIQRFDLKGNIISKRIFYSSEIDSCYSYIRYLPSSSLGFVSSENCNQKMKCSANLFFESIAKSNYESFFEESVEIQNSDCCVTSISTAVELGNFFFEDSSLFDNNNLLFRIEQFKVP